MPWSDIVFLLAMGATTIVLVALLFLLQSEIRNARKLFLLYMEEMRHFQETVRRPREFQESAESLRSSIASLQNISSSLVSFMRLGERGWNDPAPECSEKSRLVRIETALEGAVKILEKLERDDDEGE